MEFLFERELELIDSNLKKVSYEIEYEVNPKGKNIEIIGFLIFVREYENNGRLTEVKDKYTLDITVPKTRLIDKETKVNLFINNLNYELNDTYFKITCNIILTNINEQSDVVNI